MFRFPIHNVQNVQLEYSEQDLVLVQKMAFDFQLYHLSLEDLHENLQARGTDGIMTYSNYQKLFRDLGSSKADDVKLAAIFNCFDRTASGLCDITELTCGLSILCKG